MATCYSMNLHPILALANRPARPRPLIAVFLCSFLLICFARADEVTYAPSSRTNAASSNPRGMKGIVLDDTQGETHGPWITTTTAEVPRLGCGFLQDDPTNKVEVSITYTPEIPEAGDYKITLISPPDESRARNVPVTIVVQGGLKINMLVDQRNRFATLGTFKLPKGRLTSVTVSNTNTAGCVVADGIQCEPVTNPSSKVRKKR